MFFVLLLSLFSAHFPSPSTKRLSGRGASLSCAHSCLHFKAASCSCVICWILWQQEACGWVLGLLLYKPTQKAASTLLQMSSCCDVNLLPVTNAVVQEVKTGLTEITEDFAWIKISMKANVKRVPVLCAMEASVPRDTESRRPCQRSPPKLARSPEELPVFKQQDEHFTQLNPI